AQVFRIRSGLFIMPTVSGTNIYRDSTWLDTRSRRCMRSGYLDLFLPVRQRRRRPDPCRLLIGFQRFIAVTTLPRKIPAKAQSEASKGGDFLHLPGQQSSLIDKLRLDEQLILYRERPTRARYQ